MWFQINRLKSFFRSNINISMSILMYFILKVILFSFEKSFGRTSNNLKILNRYEDRYLRLKFESLFFRLKIQDAYRIRISHLVHKFKTETENKLLLQNYLAAINDQAFFNWINLPKDLKDFLDNFRFRELNLDFRNEILDENVSVFIGGPKTNFSKVDLKAYDYLVFNKPPPNEIIKAFTGKKILVFCGPTWLTTKQNLVIEILREFNNIEFISQANNSLVNNFTAYSQYPNFPFGACLMNLQRTLIATNNIFVNSKFVVNGYDFSIYKDHHSTWYQKKALLTGSNLLWTLGRHDFMLCLLFTKNFFRDNQGFEGETVSLLNNELSHLMEDFQKTYAYSKVRF